MIYTHVAAAAIAATLSAAGAYQVQEWRYGNKEKDHVKQHAEEAREALTLERKRTTNLADAQNAGTRRLSVLRADAAVARDERDGLRAQSDAALLAAAASHAACTERIATFGVVLNRCAAAYQELGAVADRHASDVKTLSDAWPK